MRALTEYPDPPGFCVEQICAAVEKVSVGKESPQSGHYRFPPIRRDGHLSHISIRRSFSCVVHRHISAAEAQTVWGLLIIGLFMANAGGWRYSWRNGCLGWTLLFSVWPGGRAVAMWRCERSQILILAWRRERKNKTITKRSRLLPKYILYGHHHNILYIFRYSFIVIILSILDGYIFKAFIYHASSFFIFWHTLLIDTHTISPH